MVDARELVENEHGFDVRNTLDSIIHLYYCASDNKLFFDRETCSVAVTKEDGMNGYEKIDLDYTLKLVDECTERIETTLADIDAYASNKQVQKFINTVFQNLHFAQPDVNAYAGFLMHIKQISNQSEELTNKIRENKKEAPLFDFDSEKQKLAEKENKLLENIPSAIQLYLETIEMKAKIAERIREVYQKTNHGEDPTDATLDFCEALYYPFNHYPFNQFTSIVEKVKYMQLMIKFSDFATPEDLDTLASGISNAQSTSVKEVSPNQIQIESILSTIGKLIPEFLQELTTRYQASSDTDKLRLIADYHYDCQRYPEAGAIYYQIKDFESLYMVGAEAFDRNMDVGVKILEKALEFNSERAEPWYTETANKLLEAHTIIMVQVIADTYEQSQAIGGMAEATLMTMKNPVGDALLSGTTNMDEITQKDFYAKIPEGKRQLFERAMSEIK